jgi:hypothetical protein
MIFLAKELWLHCVDLLRSARRAFISYGHDNVLYRCLSLVSRFFLDLMRRGQRRLAFDFQSWHDCSKLHELGCEQNRPINLRALSTPCCLISPEHQKVALMPCCWREMWNMTNLRVLDLSSFQTLDLSGFVSLEELKVDIATVQDPLCFPSNLKRLKVDVRIKIHELGRLHVTCPQHLETFSLVCSYSDLLGSLHLNASLVDFCLYVRHCRYTPPCESLPSLKFVASESSTAPMLSACYPHLKYLHMKMKSGTPSSHFLREIGPLPRLLTLKMHSIDEFDFLQFPA